MTLENGSTPDHNSLSIKDLISNLLREVSLQIDFIKKDGSERSMLCTLRADLIPYTRDESKETTPKKPDEHNLTVWDIENAGFRKIQVSTISSVRIGREFLPPINNTEPE